LLSFPHRYSKAPDLPSGLILKDKEIPSPEVLNKLLARCNLETHPPKLLALALKRSDCHLSIFEECSKKLYGFVRVTSDQGLNANLWDLSAEPGKSQDLLISILVHRVLKVIRQDLPGCSISIAAPSIAIKALQQNGFILDPGGIRTMGFRV
tara:strand:- start:5708 stop:6163 length:456 start_codon:yes stop_codon:yes gene_type:complete